MPGHHSFGDIHLDVTAGRERVQSKADSETPFRIAILGDFSGRGNHHRIDIGDALANKKPIRVDRDNFDSVFARISPQLDLLLGGEGGQEIALKFGELDDFHPDQIFQRTPLFRKLRETRDKLNDPATFARTAEEIGIVGGRSSATPPPATSLLVFQAVMCNRSCQGASWIKWRRRLKREPAHPYPPAPRTRGPHSFTKLLLPM